MTPSSSFNTDGGINEIPLPGAVGKLWLCGKHFIGPKVEQVITDFNIQHVVCLVEEHELVGRYDNYIQWHRDNANNGGIWFAMPDLSYPDFDDCFEKVNGLAELVRDQGNMLVHCAAGIGRAGTTATAILMILGMDEEEATHHVRLHRPMAGPEAGTQRNFITDLSRHLMDQRGW